MSKRVCVFGCMHDALATRTSQDHKQIIIDKTPILFLSESIHLAKLYSMLTPLSRYFPSKLIRLFFSVVFWERSAYRTIVAYTNHAHTYARGKKIECFSFSDGIEWNKHWVQLTHYQNCTPFGVWNRQERIERICFVWNMKVRMSQAKMSEKRVTWARECIHNGIKLWIWNLFSKKKHF